MPSPYRVVRTKAADHDVAGIFADHPLAQSTVKVALAELFAQLAQDPYRDATEHRLNAGHYYVKDGNQTIAVWHTVD